MQPKMGKMDIDYQVLHDAFFRYQTKPKMTGVGEVYYEGKEFEANHDHVKPGVLSEELREALGMPPGAPPPWLIYMQRYAPAQRRLRQRETVYTAACQWCKALYSLSCDAAVYGTAPCPPAWLVPRAPWRCRWKHWVRVRVRVAMKRTLVPPSAASGCETGLESLLRARVSTPSARSRAHSSSIASHPARYDVQSQEPFAS
jgi:hypothetical protein